MFLDLKRDKLEKNQKEVEKNKNDKIFGFERKEFSCFINANLVSLFHLNSFKNEIKNNYSETGVIISKYYEELEKKSVYPKHLIELYKEEFNTRYYHDAESYLQRILNDVGINCLNISFKYLLTPKSGNKDLESSRITTERGLHLADTGKNINIAQMIRENFCSDITYNFGSGDIEAIQKITLMDIQNSFYIVLQPFLDVDYNNYNPKKYDLNKSNINKTKIKFFEDIDLKEFIDDDVENKQGSYLYELKCIIHFTGTNNYEGHYIAYIKKNNQWIEIDDNAINYYPKFNDIQPYILFYQKVENSNEDDLKNDLSPQNKEKIIIEDKNINDDDSVSPQNKEKIIIEETKNEVKDSKNKDVKKNDKKNLIKNDPKNNNVITIDNDDEVNDKKNNKTTPQSEYSRLNTAFIYDKEVINLEKNDNLSNSENIRFYNWEDKDINRDEVFKVDSNESGLFSDDIENKNKSNLTKISLKDIKNIKYIKDIDFIAISFNKPPLFKNGLITMCRKFSLDIRNNQIVIGHLEAGYNFKIGLKSIEKDFINEDIMDQIRSRLVEFIQEQKKINLILDDLDCYTTDFKIQLNTFNIIIEKLFSFKKIKKNFNLFLSYSNMKEENFREEILPIIEKFKNNDFDLYLDFSITINQNLILLNTKNKNAIDLFAEYERINGKVIEKKMSHSKQEIYITKENIYPTIKGVYIGNGKKHGIFNPDYLVKCRVDSNSENFSICLNELKTLSNLLEQFQDQNNLRFEYRFCFPKFNCLHIYSIFDIGFKIVFEKIKNYEKCMVPLIIDFEYLGNLIEIIENSTIIKLNAINKSLIYFLAGSPKFKCFYENLNNNKILTDLYNQNYNYFGIMLKKNISRYIDKKSYSVYPILQYLNEFKDLTSTNLISEISFATFLDNLSSYFNINNIIANEIESYMKKENIVYVQLFNRKLFKNKKIYKIINGNSENEKIIGETNELINEKVKSNENNKIEKIIDENNENNESSSENEENEENYEGTNEELNENVNSNENNKIEKIIDELLEIWNNTKYYDLIFEELSNTNEISPKGYLELLYRNGLIENVDDVGEFEKICKEKEMFNFFHVDEKRKRFRYGRDRLYTIIYQYKL
jgi:hypothetical protein